MGAHLALRLLQVLNLQFFAIVFYIDSFETFLMQKHNFPVISVAACGAPHIDSAWCHLVPQCLAAKPPRNRKWLVATRAAVTTISATAGGGLAYTRIRSRGKVLPEAAMDMEER